MLVSALLAGDAVERRSRSLFTTSTEKSSLRAPDAIARGKAWGAWMHRSTILQGNQRDNLKHQQRHDAPASQPEPRTDPNQDGSISKPLAISEASPVCSLSGQLRRQLLRRATDPAWHSPLSRSHESLVHLANIILDERDS